jgi:hypothetical protein
MMTTVVVEVVVEGVVGGLWRWVCKWDRCRTGEKGTPGII